MVSSAIPNCPYVGLDPYDEDDAQFFYGRDPEKQIITANLLASRLTLLYGMSGVGKSSVLRAGVVHQLSQLARDNLAETGTAEHLPVIFRSWQDDPLPALTAQVRRTQAALAGNGAEAASSSGGLVDTLRACSERLDARLLIILDQFEEYLLYHGRESGKGTFAAEFPRALDQPDLRASFLISIREDALARLDRFKGSIPNLFDNYLRINHLDRSAAKDAILRPVEQFNKVRGLNGNGVRVEPELVTAVLSQVKTGQVAVDASGLGVVQSQSSAGEQERIETPYLQLVMTRLWQEEVRLGEPSVLRAVTLDRLGGAEQIVRAHLDSAIQGLSAPERDAAAKVFRHLVTSSGTKIAHTAADLAEFTDLPQSRVGPMLERMCGQGARILRPVAPAPGQAGELRYEICHDVLAPAVLDWRTRHTLQSAERKRRRARVRAIGSVLLAGLFFLLLWNLWTLWKTARQFDALHLSTAAVDNLLVDPELSLLLGLQAESKLATKEGAPTPFIENALYRGLQASRARLTVGDGARVNGVAFSPDGARLAVAGPGRAVTVYDALSGRVLDSLIADAGEVRDVAISSDGVYLAAAGNDGIGRIWDTRTGKVVSRLEGHTGGIERIALSPRGDLVATASWDSTARVWTITGQERLAPLGGHEGPVYGVAFDSRGRLATSGADGKARLWDAANGHLVGVFDHAPYPLDIYALALSADGRYLATGGRDGVAKVWSVFTGREVFSATGHNNTVHRIAFSPDGGSLLTASADLTAKVWDLSTGKELFTLSGHRGTVIGAAFSSDRNIIGTASWDGTARTWDASPAGGRDLLSVPTDGTVQAATFSPDGHRLVTAAWTGSIAIRDALTGTPLRQLSSPTESAYGVEYNRAGDRLAAAFAGGAIRVWNALTGDAIATLSGHKGAARDVAFSPDGSRLASAGEDGLVLLWDTHTWQATDTLRGHEELVNAVAFSPDGRRLATASWDETVKLWDVASGELLDSLKGHDGWVTDVAFNADGSRLASSSADRTVRVWDTGSGESQYTLNGHTGTIWAVRFSPDGQRLATVAYDGTLRLWDGRSGRNLVTLPVHTGQVYALAFNPAGDRVATGGADQTVRLLPMFSRNLSKAAWLRITRPLRPEECKEFLKEEACPASPAERIIMAKARARDGDVGAATDLFEQAIRSDPHLSFDPAKEARRLAAEAHVERALGFFAISELDSAAVAFERAHVLDSSTAVIASSQVISTGEKLARDGAIPEAVQTYEMAGRLHPDMQISAPSWNTLCWYGGLRRRADLVLDACKRAVELDSTNGGIRDSRGLVLALLGDTAGARKDFEAFLEWSVDEEMTARRQSWISAFDKGQNPFSDEELEALLRE